jgi:hypothetical protein
MIMPPRMRKLALTAHVVASVALVGAVAAFLALAVLGLTGTDAASARAAYPAMAVMAWVVIIPLAFASLVTGIIQSLGTSWGLFVHYWLVVKLALTVFAIVVLLLQMRLIDDVARVAAARPLAIGELLGARMSFILHSAGGLVVLLLAVVLSIYKPRGTTPWGQRRLLRSAVRP